MSLIPATAPAPVLPRRRQVLFGTAFASAGFAILILTLIGLYLEARAGDRALWLSENNIPLTQPNVQFGTLLIGSVMAQWAAYSISRDDRGHTYLALGITILTGLAFINQTWFLLSEVGMLVTQAEGPYFYAVVGSHLAMVGAALLFLGAVTLRALGGNFSSRNSDAVSAAAMFWHVTVALYSVLWLAVYIMK
jgi:heme/copper-type cytochrome/quinol oxidase subunit 3